MNDETMVGMPPTVDDEMPAPPTADASKAVESIDDTYDTGLMDKVEKIGEPFPAGTYHMRLDGYTEGWGSESQSTKENDAKTKHLGDQPYFMLQFICQEEPSVGKRWGAYVGWCNAETFKLAAKGDAVAVQYLKNRLSLAKTLMEGLEWKPQPGKSKFKDFINSHPEGKFTLRVSERKSYVNGKLGATGEFTNNLVKCMPLYKVAG